MSETIEVDHELWNKQKKAGKLSKLYFWTANLVALGSVMFLFEAHRVFDEAQHRFNYFQSLAQVETKQETGPYVDPIEVEQATFDLIQIRRGTVGTVETREEYTRFWRDYPDCIKNAALKRAGNDSLSLYSVEP